MLSAIQEYLNHPELVNQANPRVSEVRKASGLLKDPSNL